MHVEVDWGVSDTPLTWGLRSNWEPLEKTSRWVQRHEMRGHWSPGAAILCAR